MIEGGGADFNLIDITSLCLTPLLASIYIYIYIAHTWGQELVMERAKHNGIIAHNLRLFEPEVLENEFLIPRDGLSIYLSIYLSITTTKNVFNDVHFLDACKKCQGIVLIMTLIESWLTRTLLE